MKRTTVIATLIAALAAAPAIAQDDGLYAGVSVGQIHYKETGFDTAKPSILVGRLGTLLNPNLAVEGRIGFGIGEDTVDVLGVPVNVEADQLLGVYLRGLLPISPDVSVYGLLGYTDGELTFTGPGGTLSDSDSDLSFGVGADFAVRPGVGVNVEYGKFFSESDYDVYGWTIGLVFEL